MEHAMEPQEPQEYTTLLFTTEVRWGEASGLFMSHAHLERVQREDMRDRLGLFRSLEHQNQVFEELAGQHRLRLAARSVDCPQPATV
jgi:hypothetical protein